MTMWSVGVCFHRSLLVAVIALGPSVPALADGTTADIIFAEKAFYATPQYVDVSGQLSGQGIGYPNNTTDISCYRDRGECMSSTIEQIGPNQLGRLQPPFIFQVTRWGAESVTAVEGGDALDCYRVTLTINLKSQQTLWLQEPTNTSQALCTADITTYLWTIDSPNFWNALKTPK